MMPVVSNPSGPTVAPFGTWTSPITAAAVAAAAVRLGAVAVHDQEIYWLEGRPAEGGRGVLVKRGRDGRISDVTPEGTQLAWIAWNHPEMPWDGTELWLSQIAGDGTLANPRRVAGGTGESIFQPGWSPDGTLYFVSDRTGWWNLYCLAGDSVKPVYA